METLGTIVVVILAIALLVTPVLMLRSKNPHPWPAIVGAMLTSGICYTVGGDGQEASGPSVATVIASIVGFLSVVAAFIALMPRSGERPTPEVTDHPGSRGHRPRWRRSADHPRDRLIHLR